MWWKRFFHHCRQFSAIAQYIPDSDSDPDARTGAFTFAHAHANWQRNGDQSR
jgi:hypothetical protein